MSLPRLTSVIAAGALAAVTLVSAPSAGAAPRHERSLATVLAADGNRLDHNWQDFDILDKAVHAVLAANPGSPVRVLADGSVRLTAFLPTDRAFQRLVTDLTGHRRGTERGVLTALTKLVDAGTLENVLLYHVVPGSTITYRQAQHAGGARLATALSGGTVRVQVTHRRHVWLRDADPNDRNPWVLKALSNVNQGNKQIAHGIDRVLRPADL
jgi:hypothetical protein